MSKFIDSAKVKAKEWGIVDKLIVSIATVFIIGAAGFGYRVIAAVFIVEQQASVDSVQDMRIDDLEADRIHTGAKMIQLERGQAEMQRTQEIQLNNIQQSLDNVHETLNVLISNQ